MHHADFSRAFEAEAKAAGDAKSAADAKATSEARAAAESQAMISMLKQAEQMEQLESASKMLNEVPMLFCTLSSASPSFCSNVAHRPASKLPPPLPPSALPPPSSPHCIRIPSAATAAASFRCSASSSDVCRMACNAERVEHTRSAVSLRCWCSRRRPPSSCTCCAMECNR